VSSQSFPPAKRTGAIVHGLILAALALLSAWSFIGVASTQVGLTLTSYLLAAILAFIPIPYFSYRLYSLSRADYQLGRDSLGIHWGLRHEEIPLSDIEWVRPASDLTNPLRLPFLPLPGSVLGIRRHVDLGLVEFIASDLRNMLLVSTARRVFAISPANARQFVQAFARSIELGSLTPSEARSVYPTFVVARAWDSRAARFMWILTLSLNLGLLGWVSVLIPAMPQVVLRVTAGQGLTEAVPASQLILLPLASTFLNMVGWLAGLNFYRWEKQRPLAFVVWASGGISSVAFLLAVLFIISAPV
jgi:hypothetical protein